MVKTIISLILLLTPLSVGLAGAPAKETPLKDTAPDRYIVVEGDTLWSIAGRFLQNAWQWPEVLKMSQEQIRNPNRTYPGDVIVLDRSAHEARLRLVQPEIVTLSKGSQEGLEAGHVLAVYRSQSSARYELRTSPLFGRTGPTGSDSPIRYFGDEVAPRDAPLYERGPVVTDAQIAKLPDERYGLVMVFRTFDRAAFALVMQASRQVSVNDIVLNP